MTTHKMDTTADITNKYYKSVWMACESEILLAAAVDLGDFFYPCCAFVYIRSKNYTTNTSRSFLRDMCAYDTSMRNMATVRPYYMKEVLDMVKLYLPTDPETVELYKMFYRMSEFAHSKLVQTNMTSEWFNAALGPEKNDVRQRLEYYWESNGPDVLGLAQTVHDEDEYDKDFRMGARKLVLCLASLKVVQNYKASCDKASNDE